MKGCKMSTAWWWEMGGKLLQPRSSSIRTWDLLLLPKLLSAESMYLKLGSWS